MQIFFENDCDIVSIVSHLKEGKILVYPTETCYGFGCDATNASAVSKIFDIKKRQKKKTVLIIVSSIQMAMEYIFWNEKLQRVAERYWPGPLTIVAPAKNQELFPEGVVAEDGTLAFRISSHPFVEAIVEELQRPLVSTSANISSQKSPYNIEDVKNMFANCYRKPDIVIDAGELPHKAPSTIIRINQSTIEILRQGELIIDSKI